MSSNNKNKNSSKTDRPSEIVDAGRSSKKSRESFHFPGRHQTGAAGVYNRDRGHRDNSRFLGRLFNNNNKAICFARPMQLGKTTLFSLANELFSVNECPNMDTELIEYSPNDDEKNKWFVLRIDFGAICSTHSEGNEEEDWAALCERLDKDTGAIIKTEVLLLLLANPQLKTVFDTVSLGVPITEQSIIVLVTCLFKAVKAEKGRLLILVDEYDRPVREGLLQLIPSHAETLYERVRSEIKACFRNYFGFFQAVKTLLEGLPQSKIWLTGITPIGIRERSGLNVTRLTFNDDMADAVGLTESDVRQMLKDVRQHAQFEFTENEFECAMESLKRNFNNLRFPGSQSLYHTALVNCIMNMLLDEPIKRKEFLEKGLVPPSLAREAVPSSVFDVLCNARNLRHVVNKLAEREEITGDMYKINEQLSLEHLLQETIDVNDYLTLLVHIGVVSASGTTASPTFSITSEFYRENLLQPLLKTYRASLQKLVALTSAEELYSQGEDILVDFVTSISEKSMTKLMAWAASDSKNHILELQFQSYIVAGAYDILQELALTSQEDVLPESGKRTDVTFSSPTCVVILELKQVATVEGPSVDFLTNAHEQLAGYVKTRMAMEELDKRRPVAGFVVVMYNDGADYVVEKLRQ